MEIGKLINAHDYNVAIRVDQTGLAIVDASITHALFDDHVHITRVNVPARHRKKGYGNQMMTKLCELLDRDHKCAWLEINAYGDMTESALIKWYAKFGFHPDDEYAGVYTRQPKEVTNELSPAD